MKTAIFCLAVLFVVALLTLRGAARSVFPRLFNRGAKGLPSQQPPLRRPEFPDEKRILDEHC
jgi:hypothetical protein